MLCDGIFSDCMFFSSTMFANMCMYMFYYRLKMHLQWVDRSQCYNQRTLLMLLYMLPVSLLMQQWMKFFLNQESVQYNELNFHKIHSYAFGNSLLENVIWCYILTPSQTWAKYKSIVIQKQWNTFCKDLYMSFLKLKIFIFVITFI